MDENYELQVSNGIKPLTKPEDSPWRNWEFVIRDSDGYWFDIFKQRGQPMLIYNLTSEFDIFSRLAWAHEENIRVLFQYSLTQALLDDHKAEVIEQRTSGCASRGG